MDHAGATPYPLATVHQHCHDLSGELFSNPHSQSPSSIATEHRITAVRERVLQHFKASSAVFDVVFVANATAGIKLIADGFNGSPQGFRYKYLQDAHTSLIGAGQLAIEYQSVSEEDVNIWLTGNNIKEKRDEIPGLFAFPAQSNYNGRRFPLDWIPRIRERYPEWYILLDAASYLTTTPLDYSNPGEAPDFTVLSFYKIFGYPDLGAVIVKRDAGDMLVQRRYFGGGSRDALTVDGFNIPRKTLHESLEDGTLPFHSILALDASFKCYCRIFGAQIYIGRHASLVTKLAYTLLSSLRYDNGQPVCEMYSFLGHGPIISFNLLTSKGDRIGYLSFEKIASLHGFAVRTGGMCNPGGVRRYNQLTDADYKKMQDIGKVCGDANDLLDGKCTGAIRLSFGACSTAEDVIAVVAFIKTNYVLKERKFLLWSRPFKQKLWELEFNPSGRDLIDERA